MRNSQFLRYFAGAALTASSCRSSNSSAPVGPTGSQDHSTHQAGHDHQRHDHQGGMPHRFEKADDWAKVFDDPDRDEWQKPDQLVALLAISPGMIVADIGAGTGYLLSRLSAAVGPTGQVIGVDLEPDMVRYMNQRIVNQKLSNTTARTTTADATGLADNSADRIVIVDVWHHLANRNAYATGLAKSLRSGGSVYIFDFEMDAPVGPPKQHRLSAQQIAADLNSAGFSTQVAAETLPYHFVVVGTIKK